MRVSLRDRFVFKVRGIRVVVLDLCPNSSPLKVSCETKSDHILKLHGGGICENGGTAPQRCDKYV